MGNDDFRLVVYAIVFVSLVLLEVLLAAFRIPWPGDAIGNALVALGAFGVLVLNAKKSA